MRKEGRFTLHLLLFLPPRGVDPAERRKYSPHMSPHGQLPISFQGYSNISRDSSEHRELR
jgi:hypothetical protein